jgi:hypothetical protein
VHRGGMYGEITYDLKLLDSRKYEEYVRGRELRFTYPEDSEKRERDDEIARCQEDLRQINLKLARQQREREFSRGRGDERQGALTHRAYSADGNYHIPARQAHYEPRSMSVPPELPEILADFAMKKLLGRSRGNQRSAPAEDYDDVYNDTGVNGRDQYDERIYENELDDRGYRGIVDNVNRGGDGVADHLHFKRIDANRISPRHRDNPVIDNRRVNIDRKDRKNQYGIALSVNVFPPNRTKLETT